MPEPFTVESQAARAAETHFQTGRFSAESIALNMVHAARQMDGDHLPFGTRATERAANPNRLRVPLDTCEAVAVKLELVDVIGAELDSFRIICDIRPIFDRSRERIDGAIPLTLLRLDYSKPDGESAVVEVRVTEKQITQFEDKIANAKLKLRMIKELLSRQELPIPKTKSTVSEDES